MRRAVAVTLAVALLALTGCELRIRPSATDPAITEFDDEHIVVWDPNRRDPAQLVVHLPGSGGTPAGAERYLNHVAAQGLPIIGLNYPNGWTVHDLCSGHGVACAGAVRGEILTGTNLNPLVDVDTAHSITNRLTKVLQYLAARNPNLWSRFLDGNAPRWDRIVFTGHSQGAGHAAFIGTQHAVARVVMFAGGTDRIDGERASWVQPGATPGDRYFAFLHKDDGAAVKAFDIQQGFGAPGPVVDADTTAPPFGGAHILVTDVESANPHGSVVTDRWTPNDPSGNPLFGPVWSYLCCD